MFAVIIFIVSVLGVKYFGFLVCRPLWVGAMQDTQKNESNVNEVWDKTPCDLVNAEFFGVIFSLYLEN